VKLQIWSRELTTPTLWPSGALSGCRQHAGPKTKETRDLATPLLEKFLRGHVRTVRETCLSNLKSVALTILDLTFNAQKFRGSRDPGHAPFRKILRAHVRTVRETCLSNLKSVALTILNLTFNAQKFRGSRDPGHAPFRKILRAHVCTPVFRQRRRRKFSLTKLF